jgi:hypothetical protein
MNALEIALAGCVVFFLGGTLYSMIQIGILGAQSDTKRSMVSAITSVTVINSILMLVMAGIAYFYISTTKDAMIPYTLIMIHVSMLISVVSISVSTLQQINSS